MSNTIMLIHGAWLTPASWDFFKEYFEKEGYAVHAPPWPYEDISIEQLRVSPPPELARLTVSQLVDHYERLIRRLPEAPIILGHSYGGLIAQLLLDRGLGAVGIALDPAPLGGIVPPPRVLKSSFPVFTAWRGWNRVLAQSYETFATTFAQTLPEELKPVYYQRYWAPTPGRLYYQAALGVGTRIQHGNPRRPPLLLCVGEEDITITPTAVMAAYKIQRQSPSATDFKIFPGRSHYLFHEPGWEEVAQYALDWARTHELPAQVTKEKRPVASVVQMRPAES